MITSSIKNKTSSSNWSAPKMTRLQIQGNKKSKTKTEKRLYFWYKQLIQNTLQSRNVYLTQNNASVQYLQYCILDLSMTAQIWQIFICTSNRMFLDFSSQHTAHIYKKDTSKHCIIFHLNDYTLGFNQTCFKEQ